MLLCTPDFAQPPFSPSGVLSKVSSKAVLGWLAPVLILFFCASSFFLPLVVEETSGGQGRAWIPSGSPTGPGRSRKRSAVLRGGGQAHARHMAVGSHPRRAVLLLSAAVLLVALAALAMLAAPSDQLASWRRWSPGARADGPVMLSEEEYTDTGSGETGADDDPTVATTDNEGEYVAMDGEDDNAIQNLRYDPALDHVAAGRVYDVLNEGKLDPEHTRNRNYEFPVFRRR